MFMNIFFSLLVLIIVGFALKRSELCMVKAIYTLGRYYHAVDLVSLMKVILWGWLMVIVISVIRPDLKPLWSGGFEPSIGMFIGGLIFGLGAAVNSACILSTLTRLGTGQLRMLFTLAGLSVGLVVHTSIQFSNEPLLQDIQLLSSPARSGWPLNIQMVIIPIVLLSLWAIREVVCQWFYVPALRPGGGFVLPTLGSPRSVTIALLGLAIGGLLFFYPFWSYPLIIEQVIHAAMGKGKVPELSILLVIPALLFGIIIAAMSTRQFRFEWKFQLSWILNGIGGFLMGFGCGLIPGDSLHLLFHALLSLSPHALPALMVILIGMFSGSLLMKTIGLKT